jgi:hypothetical protein
MKVILLAAAVAVAAAAVPPRVQAQSGPPAVPPAIALPPGHRAFLQAHAVGTQNYMCLPAANPAGVAWTAVGPQATLFADDGRQIITHFLSPNPEENGVPRATWQHSRNTSSVWAAPIASSSDPAYVEPGAIPWLLLQAVATAEGPDGGDSLTQTAYIQRVNTAGGVAPATGCGGSAEIGRRVFMPFEADYVFYRVRRER